MSDPVSSVLLSPVTMVVGAGFFYMLVDVSTQFTEYRVIQFKRASPDEDKVKREAEAKTKAKAEAEAEVESVAAKEAEPKDTGSSGTEVEATTKKSSTTAKLYNRFCGVCGHDLTPSAIPESEGESGESEGKVVVAEGAFYEGARTLRMGVVGCAQGFFSILYFSMVNGLIPIGDPTELSWPMAIQKCVIGFAINPLFFGVAVVLNEGMKTGGLATVWPKMRQDFVPSTVTGLVMLPIAILGYRLFSNPVHLILYNLPTSYAYQMLINYFINREVQPVEDDQGGKEEKEKDQ